MKAPPELARRVTAAFAGGLAVAVIAAGGWYGYRSVMARPLTRVEFAGDVERLRHADLEALSRAIQAAAPEGVTLASVREAARRVPWVREASVRRRFPDAVEITFQAHEAFARWNENQLLSRRGEVFAAEEAASLPRFSGPEAAGAAMIAQYLVLASTLAPLASPIAELRLSARGAWQVVLGSGLTLELGRGEMNARAQRFVSVWPLVMAQAGESRFADLRYPNGFALRTRTASQK